MSCVRVQRFVWRKISDGKLSLIVTSTQCCLRSGAVESDKFSSALLK